MFTIDSMENKSLPILNVAIDFPSCKRNGFSSEDFAEEIKKSIKSYEFKFSFAEEPNGGYFDNGVSKFSCENISEEECKKLNNEFKNLFFNLSTRRTG